MKKVRQPSRTVNNEAHLTIPAPASFQDRERREQMRMFIQTLYQDGRGYAELIAGVAGANGKIAMLPETRQWLFFDPACPDRSEEIINVAIGLAERYGNVYVSVRLYDKRAKDQNRRAEAYTLPSRIIFTDDAPRAAPIPWSMYIQTSENSGHGYLICDRYTTRHDAQSVAYALRCDPSGADLTQIVRLPGTWNTKNGKRFPVQIVQHMPGNAEPVSLDLVRNTYLVSHATDAPNAPWNAANRDNWRNLPNGGAIWASPRIRALARRRPQLATLLRGERVTLTRQGAPDDSDSAQVAALVYNLITANLPENEVRAVALYLHAQLRPNKPIKHFCRQIDAEIERYKPKRYNPKPTRIVSAAASSPVSAASPQRSHSPKSRARKDRPQRVAGPIGYYFWLQEMASPTGILLLSQAECAKELGCSVRTIKRYEAILRKPGLIERQSFNGRQCGKLIIRRGDNIAHEVPHAPQGVQHDPAPASAPAPACVADRPAEQTPLRRGDNIAHKVPHAPQGVQHDPAPAPAPAPACVADRPAEQTPLRRGDNIAHEVPHTPQGVQHDPAPASAPAPACVADRPAEQTPCQRGDNIAHEVPHAPQGMQHDPAPAPACVADRPAEQTPLRRGDNIAHEVPHAPQGVQHDPAPARAGVAADAAVTAAVQCTADALAACTGQSVVLDDSPGEALWSKVRAAMAQCHAVLPVCDQRDRRTRPALQCDSAANRQACAPPDLLRPDVPIGAPAPIGAGCGASVTSPSFPAHADDARRCVAAQLEQELVAHLPDGWQAVRCDRDANDDANGVAVVIYTPGRRRWSWRIMNDDPVQALEDALRELDELQQAEGFRSSCD